jgi:hypothetical protein
MTAVPPDLAGALWQIGADLLRDDPDLALDLLALDLAEATDALEGE